MSRALLDLRHRLQWQVALSDLPADPWLHIKSRGRKAIPFFDQPYQAVDTIWNDMAQEAMSLCLRARRHQQFNPGPAPIIQFAKEMLSSSDWVAVPTDKDGGYACLPRDQLIVGMQQIVDLGNYAEYPRYSETAQEWVQEYQTLCRTIAGKDHRLYRALVSDCNSDCDRMYQKLSVTVKTHKTEGCVKFRGIHSSAASPLKPGMRWVTSLISPALKNSHMIRDSFHLVDILQRRPLPPNSIFLRFDIKEFYMSGEHSELISRCAGYVPLASRAAFSSMTEFILGSQYVTVPGRPDHCYKVTTGSGMGLSCSGALSDLTFYDLAEVWATAESTKIQYEVWLYCRFADDGLIVCANKPELYSAFVAGLRSRARFFQLEFDAPTVDAITFLDLKLSFGSRFMRCHRLDHQVSVKETSICQPLSPTSMHSPANHASWPRGTVQRIQKLCSSAAESRKVVDRFKELWGQHDIYVMDTLGPSAVRDKKCSRAIVPFSDVWRRAGLQHVVASFSARLADALSGLPITSRLGISWSLGGVHLVRQIRRWHLAKDPNDPEIKIWMRASRARL